MVGGIQSPVESLRTAPFFAQLSTADLLDLSRSLVRRRYNAGQTIFHIGDPGGALYLIEEGRVRIYYPSRDGQDVTLAILGPHDFFGELALFDDSARSASAVTLEATFVYTLHRDEFLRHLRSNPDLAVQMLSTLARRLRNVNEQLSDLFFLDLPGRLARKLLQLADAHGVATADGVRIDLALTQTDLAEMTGSTRVSINKALRRFREAGWVTIDGRRITLCDADALRGLIASAASA